MSAFRARGRAVAEDVAVVSIDGTQAAAYATPPLTTVAQAIQPMGEAAVDHLIDRPQEVIHLTFDNQLVVRESCGCQA